MKTVWLDLILCNNDIKNAMKYILILSSLIALSCKQQQNNIKNTKATKIEITIKEEKENPIIKTQEDLIVVLKNPNNLIDAKALIENSGLVWSELVIDNVILKTALIKVPINKKAFWIDRLKKSNVFSSIEIKNKETINNIKYISENTYVKIRKSNCYGDCTVYDVVLFKNGKVIFNGIENVLSKGKQEFTISESKMKKIKVMFEKTFFDTYLESYIDKSLMDSSSTFITYNKKQIEIKLWKNVPSELVLAYQSIKDILFEKKLIQQ